MTTKIYGLIDPTTKELRYIGKTVKKYLSQHLVGHMFDARHKNRNRTQRWINSLLKKGLEPDMFLVEEVDDNWVDAEQFWIQYYKSLGCRLTNHSIGGEGVIGLKPNEETRKKMSMSAKNRTDRKPISDEHKKKISMTLMGHSVSDKTRTLISRNTKIGMANKFRVKV